MIALIRCSFASVNFTKLKSIIKFLKQIIGHTFKYLLEGLNQNFRLAHSMRWSIKSKAIKKKFGFAN